MNLFTNTKYQKLEELYIKYTKELIEKLKQYDFTINDTGYYTRYKQCSRIDIQIIKHSYKIENHTIDFYNDFHIYCIEFKPQTIIHEYGFNPNEYEYNIKDMEKEYNIYIEIKNYLEDFQERYSKEQEKAYNN